MPAEADQLFGGSLRRWATFRRSASEAQERVSLAFGDRGNEGKNGTKRILVLRRRGRQNTKDAAWDLTSVSVGTASSHT
jgi:hypothetical protein